MPIKNIVTNADKLAIASSPVEVFTTILPVIDDLLDTAKHHSQIGVGCVGLACNQIGVTNCRVIVVFISGQWITMINPEIKVNRAAGRTTAKEMCLSRPGVKTFRKRYKKIEVIYINDMLENVSLRLSRLNARIVQHEVDHLNGITI